MSDAACIEPRMMLQEENRTVRPLTYRRSLRSLQNPGDFGGRHLEIETVRDHFAGFVLKLQNRYPFAFVSAYRDLKSESNKQIQERLAGHFLFGSIAELSPLAPQKKAALWELGARLSRTIRKGGENFRPSDFGQKERQLAQQITPDEYDLLIQKAEELSVAMKFKMGPVNSAEHVMAWCFRYVRLFLESARWESKRPNVGGTTCEIRVSPKDST